MDNLVITNIENDGKKVLISFEGEGIWNRYISDTIFFAEYNVPIEGVPNSILIVPLLGNLLPIAWLHGLSIKVDALDKSFYDNLPKVLEGYKKMYPSCKFSNNLEVTALEDNNSIISEKELCFFSGGVDAYYTFFRNKKTIGGICTIWGSDIALDDYVGWNTVEQMVNTVSERYNVNKYIVKSNFRAVVNEKNLSNDLHHPGWSWWHEFQHGMGLITLMAPVAHKEGISRIYIASSYTSDVRNLTCASDPSIDNFVKFNNCDVFHDGFEANRQQKIAYIVNYSRENREAVDLRVCWISRGGKNCCTCEKCCRTMTAILLEDGEPSDFGFEGVNTSSKMISRRMKYYNSALPRDWDLIQNVFHQKYPEDRIPKEWKWFYKGGTYSINHNLVYSSKLIAEQLKCKMAGILKKIMIIKRGE